MVEWRVMQFQFLIGTLKTSQEPGLPAVAKLFQFLIGTLKTLTMKLDVSVLKNSFNSS